MSRKYKVKIDERVCKDQYFSVIHLGLTVIDIKETSYIIKRKKMIVIF